ncbi:hypothetical protein V8C37DRAFT_75168 [Trichoderma ceciliae]
MGRDGMCWRVLALLALCQSVMETWENPVILSKASLKTRRQHVQDGFNSCSYPMTLLARTLRTHRSREAHQRVAVSLEWRLTCQIACESSLPTSYRQLLISLVFADYCTCLIYCLCTPYRSVHGTRLRTT